MALMRHQVLRIVAVLAKRNHVKPMLALITQVVMILRCLPVWRRGYA